MKNNKRKLTIITTLCVATLGAFSLLIINHSGESHKRELASEPSSNIQFENIKNRIKAQREVRYTSKLQDPKITQNSNSNKQDPKPSNQTKNNVKSKLSSKISAIKTRFNNTKDNLEQKKESLQSKLSNAKQKLNNDRDRIVAQMDKAKEFATNKTAHLNDSLEKISQDIKEISKLENSKFHVAHTETSLIITHENSNKVLQFDLSSGAVAKITATEEMLEAIKKHTEAKNWAELKIWFAERLSISREHLKQSELELSHLIKNFISSTKETYLNANSKVAHDLEQIIEETESHKAAIENEIKETIKHN